MYLVVIAWLYVVLLMALAEAFSPQGTVIGALFTLLLYGALPLGIVVYILSTPSRKRALREAQASEAAAPGSVAPNAGGHAPAAAQPDGVAPVGEKAPGVADGAPGR